jgi:hypothetical protein
VRFTSFFSGVDTMLRLTLTGFLCVCLSNSIQAGSIPYHSPGRAIEAGSAATFTSTGENVVTYFAGSSAAFSSEIGLRANGFLVGAYALPNHGSPVGASFDFGPIPAGQSLVFELRVISAGYSVYSDPNFNVSGLNHVYSTHYSPSTISSIPVSGVYIGFEDLLHLGDKDYDDHQFVFTNVARTGPDPGPTLPTTTPEPASAVLLATGLLGFAGVMWQRRRLTAPPRNQHSQVPA